MKLHSFLSFLLFLIIGCQLLATNDEDGDGIPDGLQFNTIKILADSNSSLGTISFFYYSDLLDSVWIYHGDTEDTDGKTPSIIKTITYGGTKKTVIQDDTSIKKSGKYVLDGLADSIYNYDATGRLSKLEIKIDAEEYETIFAYDSEGRLTSSKTTIDGKESQRSKHKSDGDNIIADSVFFDMGSQLNSVTEYVFDDSILTEKKYFNASRGSPTLIESESYTYDDLGNLIERKNFDEGSSGKTLSEKEVFSHDSTTGAIVKAILTDEIQGVLKRVTTITYRGKKDSSSTTTAALLKISSGNSNDPNSVLNHVIDISDKFIETENQ